MLQLIKVFLAICRLKAGPQDLPKGHYLLIATILAGIIVDSFATSRLMPKLSAFEVLEIVIIYNVALLAAIYYLLKLLGYAERGVQTVIALAGSGLFISLVLLPSFLIITSSEELLKNFVFLWLAENIWRITVNAHIFRHAFSIRLLMAMILSLSYLFFGWLIAGVLLPSSAGS